MSQKPSEELFNRKPYLKSYFSEAAPESFPYTLSQVPDREEFFLTFGTKQLSSSKAPVIQAERLYKEKRVKDTSLVIILGGGNAHLLEIVNKNTREGQVVLIIDESERIVPILWEKFLNKILDVPGRHLFCGEAFISLLWNYLESLPIERLTGIVFFKNPANISLHPEFYRDIEETIGKIFSSKMSDLLTKFEFERIWVKNTLSNSCNFFDPDIPRFRVKSLVKKFSDIPALLVSAGPSLRRHCELIKKIREKVFILSCDTSLKVLLKFGIIPDGVMTLDAQTHSFFHFMGEDISDIPLFADFVSSPPLLRSVRPASVIHSITAKFQVDASGTPIREITAGGETAEEILGEIGYLQSGGSVATTAFDLLRTMGFSPIFLIGQDLAYTGREIHSTGTHHNEKWLTKINRSLSLEKINETVVRHRETRFVKSCNGQTVLTDYVLDLYRHWFEESARNVSFSIYNINDSGAYLENISNIDSAEAEKLSNQFNFHGYPWKDLPIWKKDNTNQTENDPKRSRQIAEKFLSELELVRKYIQDYETSGKTEEEIVSDIKEKLRDMQYLKQMIRKTEIYLLRHKDQLDNTKKKNLLIQSLKKEIQFLKRGIASNASYAFRSTR